jgi:hypothetical protein
MAHQAFIPITNAVAREAVPALSVFIRLKCRVQSCCPWFRERYCFLRRSILPKQHNQTSIRQPLGVRQVSNCSCRGNGGLIRREIPIYPKRERLAVPGKSGQTNKSEMNRFSNRRRPAGGFEFVQQALDMRLDRALRDSKLITDELVAFTFRDKF